MKNTVSASQDDRFAHILIAAYAKQLSQQDKDQLMALARGMAERTCDFNEASFSSDVIFLQQICEVFGRKGGHARVSAMHKLLGGFD